MSRPSTQDSIQSSNSGLIQIDESYYTIKQINTEINIFNYEDENNNFIIPDTSPLFDDSNLQYKFPSSLIRLSPDEINDSEYFTSSSNLSPNLIFNYTDLSPISKIELNRKNLIQEIIDTEESYISCLKMLSGIYLDSILNKGNNGIPIKLLLDYTNLLIDLHEDFLNDLMKLFLNSNILQTSSKMSLLVAELINRKSISIYIYQEYYSLLDLVLKLINFNIDDPEFGLINLINGYQNFLEASSLENLDLSLISLIYKPIQRISKYKLFLENLLKLNSNSIEYKSINDCLIKVDYSIKEINRYGLQEKIKSNLLFKFLNFNEFNLKFPVEYLGLPLLLGSLNVVYVTNKSIIKSVNYGAFLFKTHLILADVTTNKNKFDVIFLIPLSVSKIILNDEDNSGGLLTNYQNSFKILFEYKFKKIELLLLNFNDFENSIWKEKLLILINEINGPYKFDYSSSYFNEEQGTTSSTIIPSNVQFYDLKLDKFNLNKKIYENCYFSKVITIKVEFAHNEDHYNKLNENIIYLKQFDRTKIEYILQDFWSDELVSPNMLRLSNLRLKINKRSKIEKESHSFRASIMRRTSFVFGDALKSLFNTTE